MGNYQKTENWVLTKVAIYGIIYENVTGSRLRWRAPAVQQAGYIDAERLLHILLWTVHYLFAGRRCHFDPNSSPDPRVSADV
jgi:hypothetical protein